MALMITQKRIRDLTIKQFNNLQKESLGDDSEFVRIMFDSLLDHKSNEYGVINSEKSNIFLIEDENGVVGWSCCLDYKKYSFIMIFIKENKRRKGLGRLLLQSSFKFCQDNNIKEVRFSSNDKHVIDLFNSVSADFKELDLRIMALT